jgi:hypothetical protein
LRATLAQREIFERARADLLRAWEINDHNLMTAAQLVMVKVLREMGFRSEAEHRAEATRKVNIRLIQEGRPPPWLKLLSSSRRRRLRSRSLSGAACNSGKDDPCKEPGENTAG